MLLALIPLAVLVVALIGFRRSGVQAAGIAVLVLGAEGLSPWGFPAGAWQRALPDALVLCATVVYTLYFGLLLHHLMEGGGALTALLGAFRALGRNATEQLAWVVCVLAPLFESISGFGLGVLIAVPLLRAMGYGPMKAALLSLCGQLAVPWGALSIGMGLGAMMAGLPHPEVGEAAAILAPVGYFLFWGAAVLFAAPGPGGPLRAAMGGCTVLVLLGLGIWASNRWISPELGGVTGPTLAALWLLARQRMARVPFPRVDWRAICPYAALAGLLLTTRFIESIQIWLQTHAVLAIPTATFSLPVLYNPGASLAVACLLVILLFGRGAWVGRALALTWRQWRPPAITVLLLLVLARVMHEAGLIAALSTGLLTLPQLPGRMLVPLIAASGGFLTGSIAGSNALFSQLQVELANAWQMPVLWVVGLQNVLSGAFTAFSPARLVFAATMSGVVGREGDLLRRLLPLALALLAVGAVLAAWPGLLKWIAGFPIRAL